jgi:hypothetical protein
MRTERIFTSCKPRRWIAKGITDQDNRDGPQLLSSINPTFSWVRLAQRIPVRIRFDEVPPDVFIRPGMTCTVVMKEGAAPTVGLDQVSHGSNILGHLSEQHKPEIKLESSFSQDRNKVDYSCR